MTIYNREGREWWPENYVEEVVPTSMPSPEAWLRRMPDGGWTLHSPYHDDNREEAERIADGYLKFEPLTNGQCLKFDCRDVLGAVEITVHPDGTFELHGTVDPTTTHFWAANTDINGDSMEELAKMYAEGEIENQRISVVMSRWDWGIPFAFTIDGEKATLMPAGTA